MEILLHPSEKGRVKIAAPRCVNAAAGHSAARPCSQDLTACAAAGKLGSGITLAKGKIFCLVLTPFCALLRFIPFPATTMAKDKINHPKGKSQCELPNQ
jgi:hypothetical protein